MKTAKMVKFGVGTLFLLALTLSGAQAADPAPEAAGGKGSNASTKPGKEGVNSPGLAENSMAQQLVRYGIGRSDPLPLISAAKIMKQNPVTVESREKESEVDPDAKGQAGAGEDDEKGKNGAALDTAEAVLARAKELAGGKAEVLAMIDSVAAYSPPKTRGRVGGPTRHFDRVRRYAIDAYSIKFRGDEEARIAIHGDGDSNLDCYVYDSNYNLIDADSNYTDSCTLSWTPAWTDRFRLKIVNRGRSSNRYVLYTN